MPVTDIHHGGTEISLFLAHYFSANSVSPGFDKEM